jgi:uncharacterized membrane protein YfcA
VILEVDLSPLEALAVLGAGAAAGAINAVVGSGTLITFPVLLALGYPPVVANVSNTVGLVPGSLSGAYTYRRELAGYGRLLLTLAIAATLGAITGALLLLWLPSAAFDAIVPVLIALALILVVAQPWLARRLAGLGKGEHRPVGPLLLLGVFAAGTYGGYFGAAQGVLMIGLFGVLLSTDLQWLNGIKNLLTGLVNAVAAVLFIIVGDIAWQPALLIAAGSVVGGFAGGLWGRRLPPTVLRGVIVVVGLAAIVNLLV